MMVCLGNICRSPLAEGILQSKISDEHFVDSAGTGDWHVGQAPDKRSIQVARNYGVDISGQRARQFKPSDFKEFDLILAMDDSNYDNLLKMAETEEEKNKVRLILTPGEIVPDPYWGDERDFENVFQILDEATEKIAAEYNLK